MRWTTLITVMATLFAAGAAPAERPGDPLAPTNSGSVVVKAPSLDPASPNIFGTIAIDAGVTIYNARWRRVSAADATDPRLAAIAAAAVAAGSDPLTRLASIHTQIGRRVRWRSDLDTYHIADYWAQAGETMTRGEGDSEDIAILKMQALKAAGFAPRDIYLSVGRDHARGADTLLVVRVGSDFYSLDDRLPRPLLTRPSKRFEPIITLGRNSAWLHGRRFAGRGSPAAVLRSSLAQPVAR